MFESAKINGVLQELNIATTRMIAQAYKHKEVYSKINEQTNNKILSITSETKVKHVLSIFDLIKEDALETEEWLLMELVKTKEQLEKAKHNKTYKN